jgi:hypothetical protein
MGRATLYHKEFSMMVEDGDNGRLTVGGGTEMVMEDDCEPERSHVGNLDCLNGITIQVYPIW